jgi:hypothetical protein
MWPNTLANAVAGVRARRPESTRSKGRDESDAGVEEGAHDTGGAPRRRWCCGATRLLLSEGGSEMVS